MSKFSEVNQETEDIFYEVLENTSIQQWVEFKLLTNNNQNELYVVKKMSELFEVLTNNLNIVIILNEEIFDQLDDEYKRLVFEEALTGVHVNDNDKIVLDKPDFTTYSGMLSKHGDETMIRLKESIISLYQKKKEADDAVKQSKKNKNEQ